MSRQSFGFYAPSLQCNYAVQNWHIDLVGGNDVFGAVIRHGQIRFIFTLKIMADLHDAGFLLKPAAEKLPILAGGRVQH